MAELPRPRADHTGELSADARRLEVRSPADGSLLGRVPNLRANAVTDLVRRSRAAQPAWAARQPRDRARLLDRFRRRLADRAEEAARLSAAESGKLEYEALLGDVLPCLDLARFYARRVRRVLRPEPVRSWMLTRKAWIEREPFGVVGVIAPWNFPIVNPMRAVMAALVTGNTVVLKPSELSPLSALLMAEIAREAGLPDDVFLVATGDGPAGAALVTAGVDKISFTGSVAVGRKVAGAAAPLLVPVVLELGGKNAMIVLEDADLDRAVNLGVQGAFWNAGQICIATERVYVQDALYDRFVEAATAETRSLVVAGQGPGEADIGAIRTAAQVERLERQIADARLKGARVLTGGERLAGPGRHFAPTVVADADHSMSIMREESFGPVMPIMRVADVEEAIALANDSPYALAASIWTRRRRGERLAGRLRAGMVSVNDVLYHGAVAGLPFGGSGASGYGRVHGEEGLREMTRTRSVLVDRTGMAREPIGGYPFRRFGTRRAAALVRLLHGPAADRARGLLGILRNR